MKERFGPHYDERWLAVPFFLYNCAGCVTITVYLPTILRKGYFLIAIFNFGCPTWRGGAPGDQKDIRRLEELGYD